MRCTRRMKVSAYLAVAVGMILPGAARAQDERGRRPPGDRPDPPRGERGFDLLDANDDGRIDREEFMDRTDRLRDGWRDRMPPGGPEGRGPMARPEEMERRIRELVRDAVDEALKDRLPGRGGPPAFAPPGAGRRGPMAGPRHQGPNRPGRWGEGAGPKGGAPGRPGAAGPPPMFGRLDANQDGKLQPSELKRAAELLDQLIHEAGDRDLSPEDCKAILGKILPGPPVERGAGRPGGAKGPGGFGGPRGGDAPRGLGGPRPRRGPQSEGAPKEKPTPQAEEEPSASGE